MTDYVAREIKGFTGREALSKGRMAKMKPVERSVLDLAYERIHQAFKLFDTIVVSFSGGKDSTCVLNLTLEVAKQLGRKSIPAFFFDEEAIPYETEHYVRRVAQKGDVEMSWYSLPVQHRNGCSRREPYWWPWAPEAKDLWVRPLPPESITYDKVEGWPEKREHRYSMPDTVGLLFDPRKHGRVGMMMGIRSQESVTRLRAVLMRHADTRDYIRPWDTPTSKGNLFKVYPIYDWMTPDVWTAPKQFGWDHNKAYDLMELAGISHHEQRCAPPYGEEPMLGLSNFAKCFPDIWDKMCYRVPGAATAARYSRTQLYFFGKNKGGKPDNMSWEDYLRFWLAKHPEKYRKEIAARVRGHIDVHFRKTSDPIAGQAPHPVSGVSWQFLVNIAARGDFKGRRIPKSSVNMEAAKRAYAKEMGREASC